MSSDGLNTGDMVVELAGVVVSAAVATGAVAGAWLVWIIKRSWPASAGSFVAGAIVGFAAGRLVARILYRSNEATTVVKIGRASLASTIPAGLVGGVVAAVGVGLLALLIFGAKSQAFTLFGIAMGCGLVFGVLIACFGSLT